MTDRRQETPASSILWKNRDLAHYPRTGKRRLYLLLVVLITIALYVQLLVGGGVAPLLMADLGIPFKMWVYTIAAGGLIGAFAALSAGVSDRVGRSNLIIYGQLIVGLLVFFYMPSVKTNIGWAIGYVIIAIVEGFTLIITGAMVRDFSPQIGRAAAMGFWTIGPVGGSAVVATIVSLTLSHFHTWQSQFRIVGAIGLVVFVISFLLLRELGPGLRDQLMVDKRDRMLVELKAQGLDAVKATSNPWSQMIRADVIIASIAVTLLLLFYSALTGFGVIYLTTNFHYSVDDSNLLLRWTWFANVVALVIFGTLSDRLRVRKPFMFVGSLCLCAMIIWWSYILQMDNKPSFNAMILIACLIMVCQGSCYVTWLAAFTETIEAHNPALTATGLALWGWIGRIMGVGFSLLMPVVLKSTSTLLTAGHTTEAYHKAIANNQQPSPELVAAFEAIQKAAVASVGEWRFWFWICIGGVLFFTVSVFVMHGRWSPAAAKKDQQEHDAKVERELAALRAQQGQAVPAGA